MTAERKEGHLSLGLLDGEYTIEYFGTADERPDVIEIQRWDLGGSSPSNPEHGRHIVVSAEDLWLLASLRTAQGKREASEIAYKIAGLPPRGEK